MDEAYVSRTEAARHLGIHPGTLANWAVWRQGPQPIRDGRRTIYKRADVLTFVAERNAKRSG